MSATKRSAASRSARKYAGLRADRRTKRFTTPNEGDIMPANEGVWPVTPEQHAEVNATKERVARRCALDWGLAQDDATYAILCAEDELAKITEQFGSARRVVARAVFDMEVAKAPTELGSAYLRRGVAS